MPSASAAAANPPSPLGAPSGGSGNAPSGAPAPRSAWWNRFPGRRRGPGTPRTAPATPPPATAAATTTGATNRRDIAWLTPCLRAATSLHCNVNPVSGRFLARRWGHRGRLAQDPARGAMPRALRERTGFPQAIARRSLGDQHRRGRPCRRNPNLGPRSWSSTTSRTSPTSSRPRCATKGSTWPSPARGSDAIREAATFRPDLLVLDVMLPDRDGFELLQPARGPTTCSCRSCSSPPVILTEDKVKGLTVGGDDYVTKPFSLEELLARVRAVLRRAHPQQATGKRRSRSPTSSSTTTAHEVWRGRTRIELTPTEYKLLRYLMLNARRVLSKAQILDHVWEYDFDGDANVVETYISYLRKKLDPHGPPLIHTVRGVGYSAAASPRPRTDVSLRARLTLGLVVLAAIGLALAGLATFGALRSFLFDRVDEQLTTALRTPGRPAHARRGAAGRRLLRGPQLRTGTIVRRRRRVPGSAGPQDSTPPDLPATLPRRRIHGRRDPAAVRSTASRAESSRTATRSSSRSRSTTCDQTLRRLVFVELVVAAIVLGALAALGWWLVGLGLRPLERMSDDRRRDRGGRPRPPGRAQQPNHRSRAARHRAQQHARADRGCLRRARGVGGAPAPVRRRCVARAAHAAHVDPRLRRAVPARRRPAPEDLAKAMRRIEEEAARMGVLVDDLLLLARLDQGRPLEHEPVDLVAHSRRDAVDDARAAHPRPQRRRRRPTARSRSSATKHRLRQVLANLLANACTHTPDGTPVHVSVNVADATAPTRVDRGRATTGPGSPQTKPRTCSSSSGAPTAARTRSKRWRRPRPVDRAAIAAAHGGTAEVETRPGRGATFRDPAPGVPAPARDVS